MDKKISVIIPTFNGKGKINNILSSLEKQTFKNFEVIVVIDGSTDGTYDFLKGREWKLFNLILLQQENKGRSGARNAGAKLAVGDYLIFFDDDVIVHEEIVYRYVSLFEKGLYVTIVGTLMPILSAEKSDFQEYCQHLNNRWGQTICVGRLESPYITACNFGIKHSFFNKMGGFDDRLNDAEDFDLAVRIFEADNSIYFDNQLIVYHRLQDSFQDYIKRQLEYKKANEQLLEINPVVGKYRSHLNYSNSKRYFLWLFSFTFYPFCAKSKCFKFLPAKLKFKLFDWILEANILFNGK